MKKTVNGLLMQEIKQLDLDTEQQIHIFINKCKELFI
jgi:hypothetical protein